MHDLWPSHLRLREVPWRSKSYSGVSGFGDFEMQSLLGGAGCFILTKGTIVKYIVTIFFVALFLLGVVFLKTAHADVSRVAYQCKGDARVFLGPNEVQPNANKDFKVDLPGSVALPLRIGKDSSAPEFQIQSIDKGRVVINVADAEPVEVDSDGPASFETNSVGQRLAIRAGHLNVSYSASGLDVYGGKEDQQVQVHLPDYKGPFQVSSKDGGFRFLTSDNKTLGCKVSVK